MVRPWEDTSSEDFLAPYIYHLLSEGTAVSNNELQALFGFPLWDP